MISYHKGFRYSILSIGRVEYLFMTLLLKKQSILKRFRSFIRCEVTYYLVGLSFPVEIEVGNQTHESLHEMCSIGSSGLSKVQSNAHF